MPNRYHPASWERIALFGTAIFFIIVVLVFSIFFPDPTDFQYRAFVLVLALGGAAFSAFLPGMIEVRYRNLVRAGGALAVFLVVYVFSPERARIKIIGDCNVVGRSGAIFCNNK